MGASHDVGNKLKERHERRMACFTSIRYAARRSIGKKHRWSLNTGREHITFAALSASGFLSKIPKSIYAPCRNGPGNLWRPEGGGEFNETKEEANHAD
jgi:hypothetical protein